MTNTPRTYVTVREVRAAMDYLDAEGTRIVALADAMASPLRSSHGGRSSKGDHSDPTAGIALAPASRDLAAKGVIEHAMSQLIHFSGVLIHEMRYVDSGKSAALIEAMREVRSEEERERVCDACESPVAGPLRSGWCEACYKLNARWLPQDPAMADRVAFHGRVRRGVASGTLRRPASPHTPTGRLMVREGDELVGEVG